MWVDVVHPRKIDIKIKINLFKSVQFGVCQELL